MTSAASPPPCSSAPPRWRCRRAATRRRRPTSTSGRPRACTSRAGSLTYQIQISRQLNEYDRRGPPVPDRRAAPQRTLRNDQTWFGVFLRVENPKDHDRARRSSSRSSTRWATSTRPIAIDQSANPIAYYAAEIPPHQVLPNPNALAAQTSINGELLLFKVHRRAGSTTGRCRCTSPPAATRRTRARSSTSTSRRRHCQRRHDDAARGRRRRVAARAVAHEHHADRDLRRRRRARTR